MIPVRGRIYSLVMIYAFLNMASEWEIVSLLVRLGHLKGSWRQILTAASWRAKSLANYVYKQSNQPRGS